MPRAVPGRTRRPEIDDSQPRLVEALEIELRHMSYFDRLPPEDRGWVTRMLVRLLAVYACLMLLLVAGAGLRIGVVEPLAMGWGDFAKPGTTNGAAVWRQPPAQPGCAPRDCVSAALDAAPPTPDGVPLWTLRGTD